MLGRRDGPDPAAAQAFYGGLFGWEFVAAPAPYAVGRLGGRDVAGVGALEQPSWNTYVRVDARRGRARARDGGGREACSSAPTDALPAGRLGGRA